jgi:arsenite methyltransferase
VVPAALEGARVLDLGSGSGRDVYLIAQLVGASGEAVGVDMTDEQLATAQSHIDWHAQRFGYARPNVRFLKGYIEKLGELGLEPASFDLIVSNCVINLSIDRPAVLCAYPMACAPILHSMATVSAERSTGTTSFRWRNVQLSRPAAHD